MKPFNPADSHSAPVNYAPSVPMSVYRELSSELRASKAVIDSLQSRNQQLLQQNQFLKQEIHNVVQSVLSLGQAAGIARQAPSGGMSGGMSAGAFDMSSGFPNAIAPNTLARLAQAETSATPIEKSYERPAEASAPPQPNSTPRSTSIPAQNRTPHPITPGTQKASQAEQAAQRAFQKPTQKSAQKSTPKSTHRIAQPKSEKSAAPKQSPRQQSTQTLGKRTESITTTRPQPKLFTEQSGAYRSSILETQENKEIGGIWLVLSIILIILTAFGAGFLIMKPLLNNR